MSNRLFSAPPAKRPPFGYGVTLERMSSRSRGGRSHRSFLGALLLLLILSGIVAWVLWGLMHGARFSMTGAACLPLAMVPMTAAAVVVQVVVFAALVFAIVMSCRKARRNEEECAEAFFPRNRVEAAREPLAEAMRHAGLIPPVKPFTVGPLESLSEPAVDWIVADKSLSNAGREWSGAFNAAGDGDSPAVRAFRRKFLENFQGGFWNPEWSRDALHSPVVFMPYDEGSHALRASVDELQHCERVLFAAKHTLDFDEAIEALRFAHGRVVTLRRVLQGVIDSRTPQGGEHRTSNIELSTSNVSWEAAAR